MHVFLKDKLKAYTWDADEKNTDTLIAELVEDGFTAKIFTFATGKAMEITSDSASLDIFPGEWVVVFNHGGLQVFSSEDFHTIFKGVSDKKV